MRAPDVRNEGNRQPTKTPEIVENLFRREWGKIVATLTRVFGIERLALVEDVVQEALARAMQTWPYYGVPENPPAWIMRVARNLALDQARRETRFRRKQEEIAGFLERSEGSDSPVAQDEIKDDRLRMIFVCCHPEIPQEDQVALALRTLCGFSIVEIAHAFLTTEAAVAKRLTRAKQRIRAARIAFEIPGGPELTARLNGVLQTLYLLFNEGYKASGGERLIREELCQEAIRLGDLVAGHAAGDRPQTHALLALMLLNAARLPARTDSEGQILRLKEQNRSRWDKSMIARGMFHLAKSAHGTEISVYHLQAGIAACHCAASDAGTTDWPQILSLYDRLVELDNSPIVALNRAVAVASVHGPAAGLSALQPLRSRKELKSYYLLYAIFGEFEVQLGHAETAAGYFRRALKQTAIASEQHLLRKRLRECERELVPELPTRRKIDRIGRSAAGTSELETASPKG